MTRYSETTVTGRYREFGEHLRGVLLARNWVQPSELVAAPAEEVVDRFRFCGCGCQCYSQAEERQAIMEFDEPSATLAALEHATRSHAGSHNTGDDEYDER